MDSPIVVVSGLPRSGTSLAMRMLEAGGMNVVTDGVRAADEANPRGYFEDERVKTLDRDQDTSWLLDARGKAIKIVSFFLRHLPDSHQYRVIFMNRVMAEVLESQRKMLQASNVDDETPDDRISASFEQHLTAVRAMLARRACFQVLNLEYAEVVAKPRARASDIAAFVAKTLDVDRMAAVVETRLYRTRR